MTLGPKALALLFDHTELRPPKVKVMVKWSAIHISGSFYTTLVLCQHDIFGVPSVLFHCR